MKNLDIEKLERKNIYQAPDDFFEEMQAKVFTKITPTKKGRIFNMNWVYSGAASIAIIFGITFFVNNGIKENIPNPVANVENVAPGAEIAVKLLPKSNNGFEKSASSNFEDKKQEMVEAKTVTARPTAVVSPKIDILKSEKFSGENAEIPMDQIISSFTSADLADLGRNTEQDIYLDLYN
jgi:hypothetical protein